MPSVTFLSLPSSLPAPPTGPNAAPDTSDDASLRDAARALHEQFLVQLLRDSGFAKGFQGGGEGEAAALADLALPRIAEDMAGRQPALTGRLYEALSRHA